MEQQRRPFRHIDSLDGLRGLAATIALIGHTNVALAKPLQRSGLEPPQAYLLHLTVLIVCTRVITGPASLADALILLGNAICRRIAAWTGGPPQVSSLAR